MGYAATPIEARFHAKYQVDPNTGCWLWTDAPDKYGYGRLQIGKKAFKAHRLSWVLHNGEPEDKCVLHHCDTPPCVNPEHLFLGDNATNNHDMMSKGRNRPGGKPHPGEANGRAVFTEIEVREMRRRFFGGDRFNVAAFARDRGVHQSTVWNILNGKKWGHLK